MILITDMAKYYHCPQAVMAYIAHKHPELLRTIDELGPMRIYWSAEWGWKLDGQPVRVQSNANGVVEWYPAPSNRSGWHFNSGWPHVG